MSILARDFNYTDFNIALPHFNFVARSRIKCLMMSFPNAHPDNQSFSDISFNEQTQFSEKMMSIAYPQMLSSFVEQSNNGSSTHNINNSSNSIPSLLSFSDLQSNQSKPQYPVSTASSNSSLNSLLLQPISYKDTLYQRTAYSRILC
jgi:hypothetical protein